MKAQKTVVTACAVSLISLTVAGCGTNQKAEEEMVGESYIEVSYADGPLNEEPSKILDTDNEISDDVKDRVREQNKKDAEALKKKQEEKMKKEKEEKLAKANEEKKKEAKALAEKEAKEKKAEELAKEQKAKELAEKEKEDKKQTVADKGTVEGNTGFDLLEEARKEEAKEKALKEAEEKAHAIEVAKAKEKEEQESSFFYKLGSIFMTASSKVFATITGWFTPSTYFAKEEDNKPKEKPKPKPVSETDKLLASGKSPSYITDYAEPKSKSTLDAMNEIQENNKLKETKEESSTILEDYLAEEKETTPVKEEEEEAVGTVNEPEEKPNTVTATPSKPKPEKKPSVTPKPVDDKETDAVDTVKVEPLTTDEFIEKVISKLNKFETEFTLTADFTNITQILDDATNQAKNRLMISSINYGKVKKGDTTSYTLKVEYNTTKEQHEELKTYAKKIAKTIKKKSKTDEEILSAVNQTVIDMGVYDEKRSNIYSPFTLYKYSYGVCQAYTAMGKIILDTLGYNNGIAVGTLDGVPHTWNVLEVNGEMKHIDFTLNDNETDTLKYFLMSEEEITESREMTAIYLD